ncbi:hypothetical protein GF312_03670 [Candidatus Poribacteria bacterium]|nr:hypothetical protein [Candidatus Poribacteria bacterium]
MVCKHNIFVFCILTIILMSNNISAHNPDSYSSVKKATAARVNATPPVIDGVLDDATWEEAQVFDDFLQRDPVEGNPPTERTTFQILYDDNAIYFGINCFDSEPDKMVCRLTRRDGWVEDDSISINLDPHHDHQTGYWFTIHSSGSISDGTLGGHEWGETWDGVWEAETRLHDKGWTAEIKIPYHVLRFSPKEEYVWGMCIERRICRKNERDQWPLIPKGERGWESHFGHLEGIKGIHPPSHLEFIPYAMGKTIRADENDYSGSLGTDVRYGITSGISLNATINPDFGQVEADPAELNLSAFESFFEERRPFFVEGASIFSNGDYDFFYSRRIGKRPDKFEIPEGSEEIERPESTTILGAAKITGKTNSKTSFGVMEAVTSEEYVTIKQEIDGETVESEYLVEPMTNYLVGRVTQDIPGGESKVGLLATAVHRKDAESGYLGSGDWDLRFKDNSYQFSGVLATNRSGEENDRKTGYLSHFEFDKRSGWLNGEMGFAVISPKFEADDIGFIRRSDIIRCWGNIRTRKEEPFGPFRRGFMGTFGFLNWNYNGDRIANGMEVWSHAQFKNYWGIDAWMGRDFASMDDGEVIRGGTLIKRPANYSFGFWLGTDEKKVISFDVNPSFWRMDNGLGYRNRIRVGMEIKLTSNIQIRLRPSYTHRVSNAQWVEAIEKVVDGETVTHYVYGELDSKTLDFTTRASISFTPKLSLDLYLQPFVAIGDYENFKELSKPESYEFIPYELNENRDFHSRSLRSNVVLRWEFKPGSTLFVVWSQSRSESSENVTEEDLELRPFDRLISTFTDEGSNIFLVKVNYWLGI